MAHKYTAEQRDWLRTHYPSMKRPELIIQFNRHFGLYLPGTSIIACLKNHKMKSGRTGRFDVLHQSHNAGIKGLHYSPATEFKKGHRPANYMPVGSERVNGEGYIDVKIADPNQWRAKHQIIWEQLHGPIPKGCAVLFLDGDKTNIDTDNLVLVKRSELVRLNKQRFSSLPAETRMAMILTVKIEVKARELERA